MNKNRSSELLGIILLALGIVMACKALFGWSFHLFFNGWWTLFIIVPSIKSIMDHGKTKGNMAGLIIGGLLFLNCWGIFPLRIIGKILVPIVLLVIGVKLLSDGKNGTANKDNYTSY